MTRRFAPWRIVPVVWTSAFIVIWGAARPRPSVIASIPISVTVIMARGAIVRTTVSTRASGRGATVTFLTFRRARGNGRALVGTCGIFVDVHPILPLSRVISASFGVLLAFAISRFITLATAVFPLPLTVTSFVSIPAAVVVVISAGAPAAVATVAFPIPAFAVAFRASILLGAVLVASMARRARPVPTPFAASGSPPAALRRCCSVVNQTC